MTAFKIFLIAIILVVITYVHHCSGYAELCKNLIAEETWFNRGIENRVNNFVHGYMYLSRSEILEKYEIKETDSVELKKKKYLQEKLITDYFLDLLKNRRIKIYNTMLFFPKTWCSIKVREYISKEMIFVPHYITQYNICLGYITGYLLNHRVRLKIPELFEHLYANWSIRKIWMNKNSISLANYINQHGPEMTNQYIEYYSITYFNHFMNYVVNPICKELVQEEYWFERGYENRVSNFRNAYLYLSKSEISQKYEIKEADSVEMREKKYLHENLITGYFMDLLNRRKWSVPRIKLHTPYQWCKIKVKQYFLERKINESYLLDQYFICLGYIVEYLLNRTINEEVDVQKLFQYIHGDWSYNKFWTDTNADDEIKESFEYLYQNWSHTKIWTDKNSINLANQHGPEMTDMYIDYYSLSYFLHFNDYVGHPLQINASLRPIDSYCNHEGSQLILKFENERQQESTSHQQ